MSKRKNKSIGKNTPVDPQVARNERALALYVKQAEALYREGDRKGAINRLQHAEKIQSDNPRIKLNIGKWLTELKQTQQALPYLQKGLELEPDSVAGRILLGGNYKDLHQFDKAEPLLKEALEMAPENPFAYHIYGNLQQYKSNFESAIPFYRKALELRLNSPTPPENKKQDPTPNIDPIVAEEILWQTLGQLARAGIHAFACFGSLLGLVREGELLPNDHDIDLGLPWTELNQAAQCLKNNGWVSTQEFMQLTNTISFLHPTTGVSVDLSGFVTDKQNNAYEGVWLNSIDSSKWRITCFPALILNKAQSPTGEPIWELAHPKQWLTSLYGDWETPDSNFDTIICAENLCGFSTMTQCYAYLRIYEKWHFGVLSKAIALTKHSLKHRPDDSLLQNVLSHLEEAQKQ